MVGNRIVNGQEIWDNAGILWGPGKRCKDTATVLDRHRDLR